MQSEILIQNTTVIAQRFCEIQFRLTRSNFTLIRILDSDRNPLAGFAQLPGDGRLWVEFAIKIKSKALLTLNIDHDTHEPPALQADVIWTSPKALDLKEKSPFDGRVFIDPGGLFRRDFFRSLLNWDRFLDFETD